jgi:hypothetical protein
MSPQELKAAIALKLQVNTDMVRDPTKPDSLPIILERVIQKPENPELLAKFVLEANQPTFSLIAKGKKVLFNNFRFYTDDQELADFIHENFYPRVWKVEQ